MKDKKTGRNVVIGMIALLGVVVVLAAAISIRERLVGRKDMESGRTEVVEYQDEAVDSPKTGALVLDTRAGGKPAAESSLAELLSDRQVYFAGMDDSIVGSETVVYLENLPENEDIYMQYEIVDKESGTVIESTGLIPSGEAVAWVPGDQLADGSYTLIFKEKPFYHYKGDYIALTQGNNEVKMTIQ